LRIDSVLVTGGAGQIGTQLIKKLVSKVNKIFLLDIDIRQDIAILKLLNENKIEYLPCDLRNEDDLAKIADKLGDINYVFHLASVMSNSRDILKDGEESINVNVKAMVNLLKYVNSIRGFCFSSSMTVYGQPKRLPISEEHPTDPINIYGADKLAAEKYLSIFSQQTGTPCLILRFSSVYGPGKVTTRAIPSFIQTVMNNGSPVIYGDGTVIRDYVYIDDVVDACILAMGKCVDGVYNIGNGQGYSIKDIASAIIRIAGKNLQIEFKESSQNALNIILDISKAKRELGYSPTVDIEEGLLKEIVWAKENG